MRAGLLKEPIRILENVITINDFGEQSETWRVKSETRARLVNDGGDRTIINGEIFYSNIKTFEVRYYVDIEDFDRVEWDGKQYRVLNIQPDKLKQNKTIRTELVND
jgi:head-tail adaptor